MARNGAAILAELESQLAEEKALLAAVTERQRLAEKRLDTARAQTAEFASFRDELEAQIEDERREIASLEANLTCVDGELRRHHAAIASLERASAALQEQHQRLRSQP